MNLLLQISTKRQIYTEYQIFMNYRTDKKCWEQAPQLHLLANEAAKAIYQPLAKNEVEPVRFFG